MAIQGLSALLYGVLILNHLEILQNSVHRSVRFDVKMRLQSAVNGKPPNVWCANLGRGELDQFVAKVFDAWPLEAVSIAADYSPKDYVMWIG